jgi:hypothetical protein
MKNTLLLFLSMFTLLIATQPYHAKANHAAAGEIIWEHIADSTYRFYFAMYRDCSGVQEPATQILCLENGCNNTGFTATMTKMAGQNPPYWPGGCPVIKNQCDSAASTLIGFKHWWYAAIVTMPAQCSTWKVSVRGGDRNSNMNYANVASNPFFIESMMNNAGPYQGNSSPYLANRPTPYTCINTPFTYNNGAIDPNGDSVATELIMLRSGGTSCGVPVNLSFNSASPSYNLTNNPIQTGNTFVLNPVTGQMTFTPTLLGSSSMAIRVKEYRNGVLIGYVDREMQVQVLPCINTPVPTFSVIPAGPVQGCVGQPLNFCFSAKATGATLVLSDNHLVSIAGSTVNYQLQKTDSVYGCFNWTPAANQSGVYALTVTVKDSTCSAPNIIKFYTHPIPIFIWGPSFAGIDQATCPGEPVQLNAPANSTYTWSELSGTTGSLSCTNCSNPTAAPYETSVYEVVVTPPAGCAYDKDTITVDVLPYNKPSVNISASPGTNVWPGLQVTFTATSVNCDTPAYQWQLNGNDINGATSSTYSTTTLNDQDIVTCVLTCTDTCIIDTPSNQLLMDVAVGIKDVNKQLFSISPNPNNGRFTVSGHFSGKALDIEVMNNIGQVVYRKKNISIENGRIDRSIELNNLPNGNYLLRINHSDQTTTRRFTIER